MEAWNFFAVQSLEDNGKVPVLNVFHELFYIINCFIFKGTQIVRSGTAVSHAQ